MKGMLQTVADKRGPCFVWMEIFDGLLSVHGAGKNKLVDWMSNLGYDLYELGQPEDGFYEGKLIADDVKDSTRPWLAAQRVEYPEPHIKPGLTWRVKGEMLMGEFRRRDMKQCLDRFEVVPERKTWQHSKPPQPTRREEVPSETRVPKQAEHGAEHQDKHDKPLRGPRLQRSQY
mmetsp:Transcript_38106/g.59434  ORF Transcript_38106/g.59434 Transcript_38106/m.59434 type:complete len:174 (-) Transcript_38106:997-1518(-)